MFAIVEISGKQYKVQPGQTVEVDRLDQAAGNTLNFDRVLLVNDGTKTIVGTPTVVGGMVKAKVVSHDKGKKIDVRRFKAKVRERKARGFRPLLTKLEILSIGA